MEQVEVRGEVREKNRGVGDESREGAKMKAV